MFKTTISFFILLSAFYKPALCIEPLDSSAVPELERVVVVHRKATTSPAEQILQASDFHGRYDDLPAVLESVSGVDIRSMGGYGQYAEASIRGGSARGLRVYLDGVLLNTASASSVDLGKIPLEKISEIRISKSTSDLRDMGDGMGGVIELFSKARQDITSINLQTGSFGLYNGSVLVKKETERMVHQFNLDFCRSENDYPYVHDNGTTLPTLRDPDPSWDDTTLYKSNNQFSMTDLAYSLGYAISKSSSLQHRFSLNTTKEGLFNYSYKDDQSGSLDNSFYSFSTDYNGSLSSTVKLYCALSGQYRNSLFKDPDGHFSVGGGNRTLSSTGKTADLHSGIYYSLWEKAKLEAFSGARVELHSQKNSESAEEPMMRRIEGRAGAALQTESRQVVLNLRALYKYETDTSTAGLGYWSSKGRSSTLGYPCAETDLLYYLTKHAKLRLSASSSKRSPTFFERFGWGNSYLATPELTEETRYEADAGVSFDYDRFSGSMNLFKGQVLNKIKSIPRSGFVKVMNFADTDFHGLEITMKAKTLKVLNIEASGTFLNSTVSNAEDPSLKGKTEPFIPQYSFFIKTGAELGKFDIGHKIRYEGPCYTSTDNLELKDPQLELSGWVSLTLFKNGKLSCNIDNYLNSASFDFLNNPKPRRTYSATLNFTY